MTVARRAAGSLAKHSDIIAISLHELQRLGNRRGSSVVLTQCGDGERVLLSADTVGGEWQAGGDDVKGTGEGHASVRLL